jgi:hypothetical protein
MHLSQEEMVEYYYGEDENHARAMRHIEGCAGCAAAFADLESNLADLMAAEPPAGDAGYGDRVWSRLEGSLKAYPLKSPGRMRFRLWLGLGYAATCAVLVAGAFLAGRLWEQQHQPRTTATVKSPVPQLKQRVVVVVLGDHLDRSERLLVQLKHVDAGSDENLSPLRDEARSLLAANQICRREAEKTGDPALEKALNHLDRLLKELAKQPGGMNAASIVRLQKEMNENGLLFEVRVLRSRIPSRQTAIHARS